MEQATRTQFNEQIDNEIISKENTYLSEERTNNKILSEEDYSPSVSNIYNCNLFINKDLRQCKYLGLKVKLSDENIETLLFIAKAKGNLVKTTDLINKFNIESGSINKRINCLNDKFMIKATSEKVILIENGIGYCLNTDIVNPFSIYVVEKGIGQYLNSDAVVALSNFLTE